MLNKVKHFIYQKSKTIREDALAGLIVAIVALPLALGFAIASNVPPAMGVYTAIIAGFFAAVFGGSEYQISGPTGAMVVVILSVVAKHGIEGLILATILAGIILVLIAILKLGKIIEYIPSPVIVGFTAGIAFIIFFGQLNNLLGISPVYPASADFMTKTFISLSHIFSANIGALLLGFITVLILIVMPKISRRIPGSIIAVVLGTVLALVFPVLFHVTTVRDIGTIPTSFPALHVPHFTWALIVIVLPAALTIAALAAIESLLSAVVADSLTGTRHKPNKELFGQGLANIASGLFGGMPATGAIARTATNIRNGGKSRIAAMFHAIFLLIFVLAVGAYAMLIPLAVLAGILMYVAFNMVEWERISLIFKTPWSDVAVMIVTFLVTIIVDLTTAIEIGLVLAALLFMKRMSDLYKIESLETQDDDATSHLVRKFRHPDVSIYTVYGPLFFGAASRFDQRVGMLPGSHKRIKIIRMRYVPVIDATGLNFLEATFKKHKRLGGIVIFSTVHPDVMKIIQKTGLDKKIGPEHFFATTKEAIIHAIKHAHRMHGLTEHITKEELAKYHIDFYDLEESHKSLHSKDKDPVEEILDSLRITRLSTYGYKKLKKIIPLNGFGKDKKAVSLVDNER